DLLAGQKGIFTHNLILFAGVPATFAHFRRKRIDKPVMLWCLIWSAATFLVYAGNSNNYSGPCVSVRWLAPLIAPGFLVIGLSWRERPAARASIMILGGWGMLWGLLCWLWGPWQHPPLWLFWAL